MKRHLLPLLIALALGITTCFALQHLYTSGRLTIDVSDGQGHGPDPGSEEWRGAVRRAIPSRVAFGGVAVGVIAFVLVSWSLRPSHADESA